MYPVVGKAMFLFPVIGDMGLKKTLSINDAGHYLLTFKGISHTAKIYLDGQHIAEHYNAYTAFSVLLESLSERDYELVVLVDNSFSERSTLHIPNDYYTYGGIIKPVVLEKVPSSYIKSLHFTPIFEDGLWLADILTEIETLHTASSLLTLEFYLDDTLLYVFESFQPKKNTVKALHVKITCPHVLAWEPDSPNLYLLKARLSFKESSLPFDDYIERIGFRYVDIHEQTLRINQKPLFLKGFNRHEDFNLFGCSIPLLAASVDLNLLRDLHANSIRTSHYPNDERFLDLCDELGLLVWEENHARGLTLQHMKKPDFEAQSTACTVDMIQQHRNHPSIIIWGILNECASHTKEGRAIYQRHFELIKQLDKSRLLTYATCHHFSDLCLDLVDLVSLNLYSGWYECSHDSHQVLSSLNKELEWVNSSGGKDKPIIISEFGAGSLYGYRSPNAPHWSEERQRTILKDALSVYLHHPSIVGTFIWQLSDIRVTDESWGLIRPRSMNNKGIVDEYRRPKLAYETVQLAYKEYHVH